MSTLISAAGFGLAVSGAIGAASMATYYQAAQPYAPTSGAAYQSWLTALKADGSKVAQPASQWYADPYARADWDGVNIMALAMEKARSTTPSVYNRYVIQVTAPSPGAPGVSGRFWPARRSSTSARSVPSFSTSSTTRRAGSKSLRLTARPSLPSVRPR